MSILEKTGEVFRTQKLTRDIAWSMGSFFVLAISGIVINISVTAFRDAAALGVFNLAYAVYIVISQFAVWGIHYSVLRHTAYYKEALAERTRMLCTAVCLSLLLGIIFAALTALAESLFVRVFASPSTGAAIRNAALGLLLFPLNKVLLAYLNGLREMKAFSIFQGLRYFLVMLFVSAVAASSLPIELTAISFFIAECMTALAVLVYIARQRLIQSPQFCVKWMKKHFVFGSKGLLGGMFAEVNSRIDVLMIGYFLSDRATGIYSFAAMLVDGLYHVVALIRINFNPVLVTVIRDGDWEKARQLRKQAKKFVLPSVVTLSLVLIAAYCILALWVVPNKGLIEGLPSLLILLAGLNTIALFLPFDNLMVVTGHPGYQAAQQIFTVAANVLVAAILLPLLGIEGAACGTAISYLTGITMLIVFSHRLLGWQLISNRTADQEIRG